MKGLKAIREKRGLTLQQVEDLTGVDLNAISRYERGVIQPSSKTALKIANGLGVSVDELLNGADPGTREFKLILDMKGEISMNVVNISGGAPEEKTLVVTKDRMAVCANLKTAGMDKEAAKKTLWEEFIKVFDDAWTQQEKWQATATA